MDEANTVNDKVIFAVSFLAVLVTASTYKDYLTKISISIFSYNFSVFDLLIAMAFILFCSVYCSAIDKLRYSTFRLINVKFLKYASIFADFFYIISILVLPLLFFLFFSCSCINYYMIQPLLSYFNFGFFTQIDTHTLLSIFTSIIGILTAIFTFYTIKISNEMEVETSIEESIDNAMNYLMYAEKDFSSGNYSEMIITLNRIIFDILFVKLAEKRKLKRNLLNSNSIIEIAKDDGIINNDQIKVIKEIRSLRNEIAHGLHETPIDTEYARNLMFKTVDLVYKLSHIKPKKEYTKK